jgi:hypothetical protein
MTYPEEPGYGNKVEASGLYSKCKEWVKEKVSSEQ